MIGSPYLSYLFGCRSDSHGLKRSDKNDFEAAERAKTEETREALKISELPESSFVKPKTGAVLIGARTLAVLLTNSAFKMSTAYGF